MPKVTKEEWAKRVERWKDSGLTAAEYAAETGIKERALVWWRWKLGASGRQRRASNACTKRSETRSSAPQLTFVEVPVAEQSQPFEVVLAKGRTIRVPVGFDAPTLERLLAILERSA